MKKLCVAPGCGHRPAYNYVNETIKLYCAHHKKEHMIFVKKS